LHYINYVRLLLYYNHKFQLFSFKIYTFLPVSDHPQGLHYV
jgi:hypothetical protein